MHESLSFFLLTNVRASQKCLHLLSSIIHSISSTNYQYISALGRNPLASSVDDSHLAPHIPIFQLHLCFCPISICFKQSQQALRTIHETLSSLMPPPSPQLLHASSTAALLCQPGYARKRQAGVAKTKYYECPSWMAAH